MPDISTVYRWLAAHDGFRDQYARAREDQADTLMDETLHIADTPVIGTRKKVTERGVELVETDMIEHRRLQVETRKWIAAKLRPKKYGERVTQEHTGPNGESLPSSSQTVYVIQKEEAKRIGEDLDGKV